MNDMRLLRSLARKAGNIVDALKPNGKKADKESDAFWQKELREAFPNDIIISEESFSPEQLQTISQNWVWIVDPLDGTSSFSHGEDGYSIMAARLDRGIPQIAVVHHPPTGKTYHAVRGKGAFNGTQRLTVSKRRTLESMRLIHRHTMSNNLKTILHALPCKERTISGSLGLKLCRIAEGQYDLTVYDTQPNLWDIVPGALILQEAGGKVTDLFGKPITVGAPISGLLATNNTIHTHILKKIQPLSYIVQSGKSI